MVVWLCAVMDVWCPKACTHAWCVAFDVVCTKQTTMAHCKGFREGERGWDVHFVADSAQVVTTPTCDTETGGGGGGGGGGGEREDDVNSSPSYPSLFSSQP